MVDLDSETSTRLFVRKRQKTPGAQKEKAFWKNLWPVCDLNERHAVATIAALGANAIAGKRASPSLEIALAANALKGTMPLMYNVVTNICGPQPGNKPISKPIIKNN